MPRTAADDTATDTEGDADKNGDALDPTARIAARIAARVAAEQPDARVDDLLARDLAGNELTSLLVHGLRQRALRRSFADLPALAERLTMTQASTVDARRLHAFDGVVLAAASAFEALELAPVVPLGATACAGVEPNHVLLAARFAEVAADPTTGLVLHATRRRRAGVRETQRLCASQRVLRLQPIDHPGFSPHFRLTAMATAVRSTAPRNDDACERAALVEHLRVWSTVAATLPAASFAVAGMRVVVSDTRVVRACLAARGLDADVLARKAVSHRPGSTEQTLSDLGGEPLPRSADDPVSHAAALALPASIQALLRSTVEELMAPLRVSGIPVTFDFARLQGLSYYAGPFVQIHLRHEDGRDLPLGDGGALSWMAAMLSDRRERLITSGVGSQLLAILFDRTAGS